MRNVSTLFSSFFKFTGITMSIKTGLMVFVFIFSIGSASAQVTVTATAGTAGPTPYTTVKLAFDAINAGTHQGDIIININANTTEGTTPATLNSTGAGSAVYTTVLLRPTVDGVSISGNPITGFGVIQLKGADNVTIDGDNPNTGGTNRNLTINNTTTATVIANSVIRIATAATVVTSADNITIKNCNLNGNVTGGNLSSITSTTGSSNSSFGIYCGGNGGATATDAPTAITSFTSQTAPSGTTINTLLIDNNAINQCARAIVFNGAAASVSTGITIQNNLIGDQGTSLSGIPPFVTPTTSVYTKGIYLQGTNAYTITGNTLKNILSYVDTTINAIEVTSTGTGTGAAIVNSNTITGVVNNGSSAANGISLAGSTWSSLNVNINAVTNIQTVGSASANGITIGTAPATTTTIDRNSISTIFARSTGGYAAIGINQAGTNSLTITNNMIWDLNFVGNNSTTGTTFGARGIRLSAGTNHKVYHNTVSLSGAMLAGGTGADVTAAFTITTASVTGVDVRNNIFSNTMTGASAKHACVQIPSGATNSMNLLINNNAYFGSATVNVGMTSSTLVEYSVANFNASATSPSTNWRAYSSTLLVANTNNDNASLAFSTSAPFASSTNLHIPAATSTQLESAGSATVGLVADIDGDTRPGPSGSVNGGATAPDMGADEFDGTPAVPMSYVSSTAVQMTGSACSGTNDVPVLRMEVVTAGLLTPLTLTSLTINGNGTSNLADVTNYRIYYTGTSNTFSTTTPIIAATPGLTAANIIVPPSGTVTLATGTNYFWLTYDMSPTATGPSVDGEFRNVILSSGGGIPTDFAPSGVLTVNTKPVVTVNPTTGTICNPGGTAITLTAGGASTYTWNPTAGLTPTSGSPVDANPASTTMYTVTGTDGNGCTNTATATITVSQKPTVSTSATPPAVCIGGNSQLLANGNATFSASAMTYASNTSIPFETISSPTTVTTVTSGTTDDGYITVSPVSFNFNYLGTNYTSFGVGTNGYVVIGGNSTSIPSSLTSLAGLNVVYAFGRDGNLNVSNSGSLTHGAATGGKYVFQMDNYSGGASGAASATILANYQIVFWGSTSSSPGRIDIIYGTSLGTPATGGTIGLRDAAGTYINGINGLTNSTITASAWPASTQQYSFTPSALTYSWAPNTFLNFDNISNPLASGVTSTTTYTVTVTASGCTATSSVTVTAEALSSSAAANNSTICAGSSAMLTATPAGGGAPYTYLWDDPSNSTTAVINVSPATTTTYIVTITDSCPNTTTAEVTIMVNPKPTASASNDGPKCVGADLNLTGTHSGGSTFAWTGPASYSANTQNAVRSGLTLAHSGTYTFTATSAAGCTSDPATTGVTINATPSAISISPSGPLVLCTSSPAELLTASGGSLSGSLSFSSGTINLAIPDNSSSGVSNQLAITGIPAGSTIDSVIVTVNIPHSWLEDVEVNLEAPNGQNVNLVADRGSSTDNFVNTSISSDATKPDFSSGSAPFTGTFKADLTAQANLIASTIVTTSTFSDLFTTPNGNWTIRAYDDESSITGTLNNWTIKIAYTAPTIITWSPVTGLYTDDIATMAYTGTPTNTVYAKPVATETFTATASTETQFTYDGNINESGWGAALATSAGGPAPGFGAGHELNALYVQGGDKVVNFGIAGDVQNGNRILLFIDSKTGGYTNGSFGRTGAPQGIDDFNFGTTFDTGFEADYCLVIGTNGAHDNFFFDLYTLSAGGGPAVYLGDISDPKIGADPLTASNTRGFEIAIAKTLLGFTSGNIKVFAMYISDGGFLDNQFLTRAGSGDGSYGSGAVTFGAAMPDPVTVPLANLQSYCISTAMVIVGIEGTIVKNTGNSGLNTLRSVYGCITEGGTITYDQPTTATTVLTAPLDFTKTVTIQGMDSANRPVITLPAAGSAISAGKTLTLRNVDINSPGTTFTGSGDVIIDTNATTVIKQ